MMMKMVSPPTTGSTADADLLISLKAENERLIAGMLETGELPDGAATDGAATDGAATDDQTA